MDPSSEVSLYHTSDYALLLLVRKPQQDKYFLYTIDTLTGSLNFDGIAGSSVFNKHREAFSFVQNNYTFDVGNVLTAQGLVGLRKFGPILYVVLITESEPVGNVANKHTIFKVKNAAFYTLELPYEAPLQRDARRRVERLKTFPLAERHFWCETLDLTTPLFVQDCDRDFIWNDFWIEPFREIGQSDACVTLLQGTVASEVLTVDNRLFRLTIITTRESSHGGTRYYSRGMNASGNPANEVQCELVVEDSLGRVWEHSWRRGSVPVFWKTVVTGASASIAVDLNPGRNTKVYFDRLKRIFDQGVICLNLLHNQKESAEYDLCCAYENAVRDLENVKYLECDWHRSVKERSLPETVKVLYEITDGTDISMAMCEMGEVVEGRNEGGTEPVFKFMFPSSATRQNAELQFHRQQRSVLRVNCLDSLDRTNVACFFHCARIVSQIFEQIGIGSTISTYEELLQMDGALRTFLAEAFVDIGDCVSDLYTNTPACMTVNFAEVAGLDRNAMSDGAIAMQRRYHNLMTDRKRNKALNIFSGNGLSVFIPSVDCSIAPRCVSCFPGQFMPPFSFDGKQMVDPSVLLCFSSERIDVINSKSFVLLLSKYCYIDKIIIVVVPGDKPVGVTVSMSLTYGPKVPLISKVLFPSVYKATPMVINIPPDYSNYVNPMSRFLMFDFDGLGDRLSLGNIFVFGGDRQTRSDQFKTIYQDIDLQPDGSPFQPADTSTPAQILKSPLSFTTTMQFDIARILHKVGRLDALAVAVQKGVDPEALSLSTYRVSLLPVGVSKEDTCKKCHSTARWKCFMCKSCFCQSCSAQHGIDNTLYFACPVMLCDTCYESVRKIYSQMEELVNAYHSFHMLVDPMEASTDKWILARQIRSSSLTEFPNAFVSDAADPSLNLILTKDGGELKAGQSAVVILGSPTHIESVEIVGTEDCSVQCGTEGQQKITVQKQANLDVATRMLQISVKEGLLKRLIIHGTPSPPVRSQKCVPAGPRKLLKMRNSAAEVSPQRVAFKQQSISKKAILLTLKEVTPVAGILFRNLSGVQALICTFTMSDGKLKSLSFYIPQVLDMPHPTFMLPQVMVCSKVQINFIDTPATFTEPGIRLCI